jgi:hypothetical protein
MSTNNQARTERPISNHAFSEDAKIFYMSSPEHECGWYFSDCNGALFGPISDENTAHHMLAQLTSWFDNK